MQGASAKLIVVTALATACVGSRASGEDGARGAAVTRASGTSQARAGAHTEDGADVVQAPPAASEAPPEVSASQAQASAPGATSIDGALVVRCVMGSLRGLGWYAKGAHAGAYVTTAVDALLVSEECRALAGEDNVEGYPLTSGGTLIWRVEREVRSKASVELVIRFECPKGKLGPFELERGCAFTQTESVTLPLAWHCHEWGYGLDRGERCFRSARACEGSRATWEAKDQPTTPCVLAPGAAYCERGTDACFFTSWSCAAEHGGSIAAGSCVRTDR